MQESDLAELRWESEGCQLVLRKHTAFAATPAPAPLPAATIPADGAQAVPDTPGQKQPDEEEKGEEEGRVTIVSPMVGTFYRAPAPDADPYVQVGDIVEVGQPLCIIEAMKLMNEIESEFRGKVLEILVENAQPVEYGQPLFVVEKL